MFGCPVDREWNVIVKFNCVNFIGLKIIRKKLFWIRLQGSCICALEISPYILVGSLT